jgi:xylan 1,4-beta-xylosidase
MNGAHAVVTPAPPLWRIDAWRHSMNYLRLAGAALAMLALAACATDATQAPPAAGAPARFEHFTYDGKAQETIAPAPGQYRNPILSGYYPDPSVVRVGADYYLINSSFTNYPGIPVFHSTDLTSWRQIGNAISRPSQFDFKALSSSRGIYAPDISYHDGLFYIVTTCVGCAGNVVMTATDPAGPWSDPTVLGFEGIDPSLFWDADGKAYVVNNGDPREAPRYDGHRAIWIQQFDPATRTMVGARTRLVNGGVDISKKPIWIEGPHLLKRDNYYYLIAAEGGTGEQHSEVVLRATSVRGPYTPFDHNPILSQRQLDPARAHPVTAAGHAKFVQTQQGDWWAVFLAVRPYAPDQWNIGRETFLLPVTWRDGWPSVLDEGKPIPFALAKPNLPAPARPSAPLSGDFGYTDDFTGNTLSPAWIGVRTPRAPLYAIERGALVLAPAGRLGELQDTPAFVARRQQHHVASIATTVTYRPRHDGDRAGLVAYQSDESYLFFGVTRIDGRDVVALYLRAKSAQDVLVASAPLAADRVTLAMHADGGRMRFDYTVGAQSIQLASDIDISFLSTRKAGGFTGTVIGPYTWQAPR